jgi:putative transposase
MRLVERHVIKRGDPRFLAIDRAAFASKHLDNKGLYATRQALFQNGSSPTYSTLYHQMKGEPEYAALSRKVAQWVLKQVCMAWASYNSFTSPQVGANGGAVLDGGVLSLSKIGRIRLRLHRPLHGTPKTVTIRREADGWYACISCVEVPTVPLPATGQETGIDVVLKVFLITADGVVVENPRHYLKAEKQLARAQRRLSRRMKGSKRRRKAVALLKRHHQKVQHQRRDFHHNAALALLRQYDIIYLEDLRVANLVRNHYLAKSISDAGWAACRIILEAKAACSVRQAPGVRCSRSRQPTPARIAVGRCPTGAAVCSGWPKACRCAPTPVRPVDWCSTATKTRHRTFCGPSRPVRRERGPLGRASPEKSLASAMGSMSQWIVSRAGGEARNVRGGAAMRPKGAREPWRH